jgi:hypothetical protein
MEVFMLLLALLEVVQVQLLLEHGLLCLNLEEMVIKKELEKY